MSQQTTRCSNKQFVSSKIDANDKELIVILLKRILFGFTAVFSSALSAEPSSLSAFGLALGSNAADNKFSLLTPIALSEKPGGKCERTVLAVHHYGDDQKLENFRYKELIQKGAFEDNIYKLDFSERVSGGWYKVKAFEQEIQVCFVYFDDKLMNVVTNFRPKDINDKLIDALSTKYKVTYSGYGQNSHDDPPGTVLTSGVSGITMSHERLRAQFLHWAIERHNEAKASVPSPF